MRLRLLALLAILVTAGSSTTFAGTTTKKNVSVTCNGRSGSTERVVIKNKRSGPITVVSITSTYKPTASEPYRLNRTVGKKKSFTFRPNRAIFNNDRPNDRAKVKIRIGNKTITVIASC